MIPRVFAPALCALIAVFSPGPVPAAGLLLDRAPDTIRIATFNANLNRKGAGVLIQDMAKRDPQILAVAEIILLVRPDILLINEIDHDLQGIAVDAFRALLSSGVGDSPGLDYPHRHIGPMNTGVPSGFDLDGGQDHGRARCAGIWALPRTIRYGSFVPVPPRAGSGFPHTKLGGHPMGGGSDESRWHAVLF